MRLLVVVLLSVLAAGVYCSKCPPPEDMPRGCRCNTGWPYFDRNIEVTCFGGRKNALKIQEIAKGLRENFPGNTTTIDRLNIKGYTNESALTSRIFDGLRVRVLKIDNCRFNQWADEVGGPAFVGLEDSMKELHISRSIYLNETYSSESEVPAPMALGHLGVTKMKLFQNILYKFGNDWFGKGGSSVDELDIEQNELHTIGDEAMVGLTSMRNFKAELNHIEELKRSMFPEDSKLVLLDVRNNKIEEFPEDFFVNFPSLSKIELNRNPIKYVPESVFGNIWPQLNYIDFKGTQLHCDDHIDWMLDVRQPTNLLGWCQSPEDVAGETLGYFLRLRKYNRDN